MAVTQGSLVFIHRLSRLRWRTCGGEVRSQVQAEVDMRSKFFFLSGDGEDRN